MILKKNFGISQKSTLKTQCALTSDTIKYLFGVTRQERTKELSSNCYIIIRNKYYRKSNRNRCLCYINGILYHSYIGRFELKAIKIKYEKLKQLLNNPIYFLLEYCDDKRDLYQENYKRQYIVEYYDINPESINIKHSCQNMISQIKKTQRY